MESIWMLRNHVLGSASLEDMIAIAIACPTLRTSLAKLYLKRSDKTNYDILTRTVYRVAVAERKAEEDMRRAMDVARAAAPGDSEEMRLTTMKMARIVDDAEETINFLFSLHGTGSPISVMPGMPYMVMDVAGPKLSERVSETYNKLFRTPMSTSSSSSSYGEECAFMCICSTGLVDAVNVAYRHNARYRPYVLSRAGMECISEACALDHTDVFKVLVSLFDGSKELSGVAYDCVYKAVSGGNVATLKAFAASNISQYWSTECNVDLVPFALASARGSEAELLELLAHTPFCVGKESAAASAGVKEACRNGQFEALRRLTADPYFMSRDDAIGQEALPAAFENPFTDATRKVIDVLVKAPFSLKAGDGTTKALANACKHGNSAAIAILKDSPFFVGSVEAQNVRALTCACRNAAHAPEILYALAQKPFSQGGATSAREQKALLCACCHSNVAAIRVLASELYGLGYRDALEVRNYYFAKWFSDTPSCKVPRKENNWYTVVSLALSEPPYSLSQDEIIFRSPTLDS